MDHGEPPRALPGLANREDGERPRLLPEAARRVEDPGARGVVGAGEEAEGSDHGDARRAHQGGHLRLGGGVEPRHEREDPPFLEEVPGGRHAVRPVGVVSGHHELHLPAVDAAAPVEPVEPPGQDGAHGEAHVGERTGGRQDRPDAECVRRDAGIEVLLQPAEVGGQAAQVLVGHRVARHGDVERVAGRIQPLPQRPGQGRLGEGGVLAAAGVGVAVGRREVRPPDRGGAHATLRAPLPVGAVAAAAGGHAAGQGRTVPPQLHHDLAAGRALPGEVDALPRLFTKRQLERRGRRRGEERQRGEERAREVAGQGWPHRRSERLREAVFTSGGTWVLVMIPPSTASTQSCTSRGRSVRVR